MIYSTSFFAFYVLTTIYSFVISNKAKLCPFCNAFYVITDVYLLLLQLREVGRKFRSLYDGSKKDCEKLKEEQKEEKEKTSNLEKQNEELKKKIEEAPAQSGAPASAEQEERTKVLNKFVFRTIKFDIMIGV